MVEYHIDTVESGSFGSDIVALSRCYSGGE